MALPGLSPSYATTILPVDAAELPPLPPRGDAAALEAWSLPRVPDAIRQAAAALATDVPVAFPTETVYGLGADARRPEAVLNIFRAKGRPADNPLIVHVHSLAQLVTLVPQIPDIYTPLISRFWPGPLTIILPRANNCPLAPQVTAGLDTFGARIPADRVALALLRAADCPIAAPSANSSTRPSPTTAQHVAADLGGKIQYIIDGGPCTVGVESTVVDGLRSPPAILRPGGVGLAELRACPGWEHVTIAYKDRSNSADSAAPAAPGMKYRHYSPRAAVVLIEAGGPQPTAAQLRARGQSIGLVRTAHWQSLDGQAKPKSMLLPEKDADLRDSIAADEYTVALDDDSLTVYDIYLGAAPDRVARGLFAALRTLDTAGVAAMFVEGLGLGDTGDLDDVGAAVMNRLRKAAEPADAQAAEQ